MAPFYSRAHASLSLAGGMESNAAAEAQQPAESTRKYHFLSSPPGHCVRVGLWGLGKLPLLLLYEHLLGSSIQTLSPFRAHTVSQ